uniref:Wsv285 n=1 Tax=White spot syndrome virus TaxID=342409 RepID=A0A8E7BYZ3_9VIRU|nr:MAG: hypothetical protein KOBFAEHK_00037 [White spot syndrome virus]
MFGSSANNFNGDKKSSSSSSAAASSDDQQLGPLGLSTADFKKVAAILANRTESLYLLPDSPNFKNVINNPNQISIVPFLGSSKAAESGSANKNENQAENSSKGGSDGKKSSQQNKFNLLNKVEAEEMAFKRVAELIADTPPSKDNPLRDDPDAIPSRNPWVKLTQKNLEYLFWEAVTIEVSNDRSIRSGRYLQASEVGENPFLMTISVDIRILQRMALNVVWFFNRFFRMVSGLGVENRANSTYVATSDAIAQIWVEMLLKNFISGENVPQALKYLKEHYEHVYNKISKCGRQPSYFVVEFERVDNTIGFVNSDTEHNGSSYMEYRCFDTIRKNASSGPSGGGKSGVLSSGTFFIDNEMGNNNSSAAAASAPAVSAGVSPSLSPFSSGGDDDDDDCSGDDVWGKKMIFNTSGDGSGESSGQNGGGASTYKRFRCGENTASLSQKENVRLMAMPKGNEDKQLLKNIINFLNSALNSVENHVMCTDENIFDEDQAEHYTSNKELYKAIVCSNPANVYRVMVELFVNLILPRLRNPIVSDIETVQNLPSNNGSVRTKKMVEHGCTDMRYDIPPYAKGKIRLSAKRACECRKLCKDVRCFDKSREANLTPSQKAGREVEEPFPRNHNSHRSNAHDFTFYDKYRARMNKLKKDSKKKVKKIDTFTTTDDFLLQDRNAFDLLRKCFLSASLHHIFCPDVLMVHRGDSFNINFANNKLECYNERNGIEEVTSSQTVNAKEALEDITKIKMKRGDDIIDVVKSKGLSLREFSKKVSKIVRRFNEITNQLCNNCNVNSSNGDVDFHVFTSVCVYIHNIIPVLEDISIFAELGEELTKLVKECRDVAGEDKTYDDIIRNYEITVKYFKLFNALVKFCHRNYNVAVTSAINRRGYMCMVSNLVGYYCKLSDNAIQYHESLCSLHSSISYADYYTSRNNNSEDGGGNSSSEKSNADVAKTMASFYDQFDKSEDSKKNKNKTSNEILIKMFQMDRVLDGMDDDDDEDSDSSSSENEEEEEEEEIVKKPAKKRKVEDVDSNKKTLPKEPAVKKVKQEEDVEMEEVKEAAAEEEKKEEQEAKEEDATEYDDDTEEDEKAVASGEDEDDEDSKAIF